MVRIRLLGKSDSHHRFFMSLSESTLEELRTILLEEYGCDCPRADVSEIANSLVQYVEALQEIDKDK